MRKPITVALLLILPLMLLGLASISQGLTLYDNFKGPDIDPAKWTGSEGSAGPTAPNTATARKIAGKVLRISLTTWGKTDSDSGTAGSQSTRLAVTNPAPITIFQADVTVQNARVVGCAANVSSSRARAQVIGAFFNDGTSSGAGDRTGDILAGMQSHRDSILGDQILAFITRCTNASCSTSATLFFVTFAASWVQNVANTMKTEWDPGGNQFIYTLNPGPGQEQHSLGYAFSDSNPPVLDFKQLAASNSAASCLPPANRGVATMRAVFDNVMVNP